MVWVYIRKLYLFLILAIFNQVHAKDISELANGQPLNMGIKLPVESYEKVVTKRLAKAKVLWFNFDLAREMGIDIPSNGMSTEFEEKILEAFAYNTPVKELPADSFLDQEKIFYADRYGGYGLGNNWGAGRAATSGAFQIKGIGQTPLIGEGQTFDHAHGGASIKESINEAIWGEINHYELPKGGNRVLAILDSGTVTNWKDGGKEARALIVRQDAIRPAHFMSVVNGHGPLEEHLADKLRYEKALDFIAENLPYPEGIKYKNKLNKLSAGLENYAKNLGEQFAAAFARKIFHGAASPSNIELSGRFLDYGTQTALPGYSKVEVLDFIQPFGKEIEDHFNGMAGILSATAKKLDKEGKKALPSMAKLKTVALYWYSKFLDIELVKMAGIPDQLVAKLSYSKSFSEFSKQLRRLSNVESTTKINIDKVIPSKLGHYDVAAILEILADNSQKTEQEIIKKLEPFFSEKKLIQPLVEKYKLFLTDVLVLAKVDGVEKQALTTYIQEKVRLKNLNMDKLYRPNLLAENIRLVDEYTLTNDRKAIWKHIEDTIHSSQRTFTLASPYQTVLANTVHQSENKISRIVFDAIQGKYLFVNELIKVGDSVHFFGNSIPLSLIKNGKILYTTDGWKTKHEVDIFIQGNKVTYSIPLEQETSKIEFVLRDKDSKQWFKAKDQNITFKINRLTNSKHCWGKVDLILESLF